MANVLTGDGEYTLEEWSQILAEIMRRLIEAQVVVIVKEFKQIESLTQTTDTEASLTLNLAVGRRPQVFRAARGSNELAVTLTVDSKFQTVLKEKRNG